MMDSEYFRMCSLCVTAMPTAEKYLFTIWKVQAAVCSDVMVKHERGQTIVTGADGKRMVNDADEPVTV